MSLNLIDEPWLMVQRSSGPDVVGLRTAFLEAEDIIQLTGDLPTQAFANLRLMLAVAHDAIGWHSSADMAALRRSGLDMVRVGQYLDQWHDRFELFDGRWPFMQVPDLRTGKGEHSGLEKLIADVPNGTPFFTTRAGRSLECISAAEAARWLVHVQAFDPSGIRSGAVGDPLAKGGKGYPIGPSWAGQIGGIVPHGRNLAETLVNNIVRTEANPEDRPYWVFETPPSEQRLEEAIPAGPVQSLVWQSRRVRLVGSVDGVIGLVLCQGDKVTPQTMLHRECMTSWRYSKPQSAKAGRPVYMPNEHDPARALWRGLPSMLAATGQVEDRGSKHESFLAADVLESASHADHVVIQTVGMVYGSNNAVVDEVIDDRLEVSPGLLGEDALEVQGRLNICVHTADECVRAVGNLAANIARAAGEKGDDAGEGARQRAMAQAWSVLDQPARQWVAGLGPDSDLDAAADVFARLLRRELSGLADQLVAGASPSAVTGRKTSFGFMAAHKAHGIFLGTLRKHLAAIEQSQGEKQ